MTDTLCRMCQQSPVREVYDKRGRKVPGVCKDCDKRKYNGRRRSTLALLPGRVSEREETKSGDNLTTLE